MVGAFLVLGLTICPSYTSSRSKPALNKGYTRSTPGLNQGYIGSTPALNQVYTRSTPGVNQGYTRSKPALNQVPAVYIFISVCLYTDLVEHKIFVKGEETIFIRSIQFNSVLFI
ncbi:hypothetical protein CRENBAI_020249 [Crenichthys baileyi]|uniref:Uncharacterized protein n=1 Tax=Crenichthys baileyi TaxID=28760 RepID=A0AAV9RX54_9TELE